MTHFFSKQFLMRILLTSLFVLGLVLSNSAVDAQEILYNAFGNSPSGAFVVTAQAVNTYSYDSFSSMNFFYDSYDSGSSGSSSSSGSSYAPSVSITAQPLSINSGDSTTLTWSGADVSACTASGGWSGAKLASGSESTGPIVTDTTYAITCDGLDGSTVGASVTVTISSTIPPPTTTSSPAPTVSLTASPATVNYGDSTTLYWASTDASSCEASGSWSGFQSTSGSSAIGPLYSQATYTLTCTGPGGSTNSSMTVNVNPIGIVDNPPVGVLDSATCSVVNGWAYDPDTSPSGTYTPPPSNSTACWQTPSAAVIDGYHRCQQSGACTVGGTANSKCLDEMGNLEQPAGQDYCVAVPSLDDVDCNRPVPYTSTSNTNTSLSCVVGINEPAVALGISVHQGEGTRVLGNQSAADFACRQLGYNSATSFQTKGWSSCGDNQFAYDGGGFWAYGDACVLGNSGISYVQCAGTGSICQNKCGNGVIDPGEQCDSNSGTNFNRCGDPTWYCSSSCTMVSNNIDNKTLCP